MGSWTRYQEENGKELFSTTLKALFAQNAPTGWDTTKTGGKDAALYSDEDMKSMIVNQGQQSVTFEEGNTRTQISNTGESMAALDDSQVDKETEVIITVYAANKYYLTLFRDEVERVLRQNRPQTGSTVILKSDGINDSAILGYSWPLPEWTNFELGLNTPERSAKSQMILKVYHHMHWS